MTAAADGPAQNASEAGQNSPVRPRSLETIFVLSADPRSEPKALPEFPNPAMRRAGLLPPLVLRFQSDVPRGVDVALGRHPRRHAAGYLRAIDGAGNRSIVCDVDCSGGDANSAIEIARALLKHPYSVTARIIGRCSSAAVFIALAADNRVIDANGTVLIHKAARICTKAQFEALRLLSAEDKAAIDESLNDTDDATAALLVTRLGVSESVARAWMGENRKWSATEALLKGFVSAVIS